MELEIEMEEASSSETHSTGSSDEIHSLLRAVNVGFSVKIGGGGCCKKEEEVEKIILDNINLECSPGEMIAVMGPSGAGKTSFIKLLGRRRNTTEGYVALGTTRMSATKFRKCIGYVSQETILPPQLQVRELLKFYADMRLANKTKEEKYERIDQVLKDLGLTRVKDTQVGSDLWETGGVSGGERKRVAIAVEMLSDPQILILDEPTSGLDASTSMSLCETLRDLARKRNKSILATIHQPRQQIFEGFTKLLLLSKGRVAYYGTTSQAAAYFDSIGLPIPPFTSVADHVIDCVAVGQGTTEEDVNKLLDTWEKNPNKGSFLNKPEGELQEPLKRKFSKRGSLKSGLSSFSKLSFSSSSEAEKTKSPEDKEALDKLEEMMNDDARAGWFTQMSTIFVKDFRVNWRDPVLWQVKLTRSLFLALLIGLVYLQLGDDQESIRSRAGVIAFLAIGTGFTITEDGILVFHQSRLYYSRDLAVSLYDASSFYIATLLIHLPSTTFFGVLQLTIAYWMVGLREDAGAFFLFLLFQGALLLPVCIAFGFFISILTPNVTAASAIAPTAMSFFTMFGGTFLADGDIPDWLIWAKWISPIRAVYTSCFLNEFEGTTWECDESSFCLETGEEVIEYYGFGDDNKWVNLGILLGEFAFCTVVAYGLLVYKESKTYPR